MDTPSDITDLYSGHVHVYLPSTKIVGVYLDRHLLGGVYLFRSTPPINQSDWSEC